MIIIACILAAVWTAACIAFGMWMMRLKNDNQLDADLFQSVKRDTAGASDKPQVMPDLDLPGAVGDSESEMTDEEETMAMRDAMKDPVSWKL